MKTRMQWKSITILTAICAVVFAIQWKVAGEAPLRAAAMASVWIAVLVVLRAIEPKLRQNNEKKRTVARQKVMGESSSAQTFDGADRNSQKV